MSVPEIVREEILREARQDQRFAAAGRVWQKLPPRLMEVLRCAHSLSLLRRCIESLECRWRVQCRSGKDYGEIMVIAHVVIATERWDNVIVFIDDGGGHQSVAMQHRRLQRLSVTNDTLGRIDLASTVTVLTKAAGSQDVPDEALMRRLHERLRTLEDGLVPIASTGLMELPCRRASSSGY